MHEDGAGTWIVQYYTHPLASKYPLPTARRTALSKMGFPVACTTDRHQDEHNNDSFETATTDSEEETLPADGKMDGGEVAGQDPPAKEPQAESQNQEIHAKEYSTEAGTTHEPRCTPPGAVAQYMTSSTDARDPKYTARELAGERKCVEGPQGSDVTQLQSTTPQSHTQPKAERAGHSPRPHDAGGREDESDADQTYDGNHVRHKSPQTNNQQATSQVDSDGNTTGQQSRGDPLEPHKSSASNTTTQDGQDERQETISADHTPNRSPQCQARCREHGGSQRDRGRNGTTDTWGDRLKEKTSHHYDINTVTAKNSTVERGDGNCDELS